MSPAGLNRRIIAAMTYVALLRGINVGGNNKLDMKELKASFESVGLGSVETYINSGNVIFEDDRSGAELAQLLEGIILRDFNLTVKVLLRDQPGMAEVARSLPGSGVNDKSMKCDVMFLWEGIDGEDILEKLPHKPGVGDIRYVRGAVIWRVDRVDLSRSGMNRLIGTKLYQQMTIRNCNTTRKIIEMMSRSGR